MKRIVTLALIATIAISLVGCGEKTTGNNNVQDTKATIQETSRIQSLATVCKYMEDNGAVTGTQTVMDASQIGAVSGAKYKDSKIEIYEFDENSEDFKVIKETKKATLKSMNNYQVDVSAINGNYIIISTGGNDKAVETFKDIK